MISTACSLPQDSIFRNVPVEHQCANESHCQAAIISSHTSTLCVCRGDCGERTCETVVWSHFSERRRQIGRAVTQREFSAQETVARETISATLLRLVVIPHLFRQCYRGEHTASLGSSRMEHKYCADANGCATSIVASLQTSKAT
jgi:hypothetical protein